MKEGVYLIYVQRFREFLPKNLYKHSETPVCLSYRGGKGGDERADVDLAGGFRLKGNFARIRKKTSSVKIA